MPDDTEPETPAEPTPEQAADKDRPTCDDVSPNQTIIYGPSPSVSMY